MASTQFMALAIIAVILFPAVAMATQYIVGDDAGWTINYDYEVWANGKTFYVGDQIVFKYPVGYHNVFKVNETAFEDCIKPPADEALTSGNDTITFIAAGNKWYICGVSDHCADFGQKLAITVNDFLPPAPAPSPIDWR